MNQIINGMSHPTRRTVQAIADKIYEGIVIGGFVNPRYLPRASGKTTALVNVAMSMNIGVLVSTSEFAKQLRLDFDYPLIFSVRDGKEISKAGVEKFVIDEYVIVPDNFKASQIIGGFLQTKI